jgi:hypothetical protein
MAPPDRMSSTERIGPPLRDDRPLPPMSPPGQPPMAPRPISPMAAPSGPPPRDGGYGRYDEPAYGGESFDGFESGRHGKMDMTAEIRMPEPGMGLGSPTLPPSSGMPGPGMGGPGAPVSGDVYRVDQLRRTFQPRRFGSGYDPHQVDRFFENIINAMTGRTGVQIGDAELDPGQFSLVPGGYFEAEVDAALREVRDILRRR